MFKDKIKVFIKEEDGYNIYATSITEEEVDKWNMFLNDNTLPLSKENKIEFNKEFEGFPVFDDLISIGDPSYVSKTLVKSLMDYVEIRGNKHYKCFVIPTWDKNDTTIRVESIHDNYMSSWLCLVEKLNKPDNILIFKEKI